MFTTNLFPCSCGEDGGGARPDDLQLAVAALLVEAAWRDDVFEPVEPAQRSSRVLGEYFHLSRRRNRQTDHRRGILTGRTGQLFRFTSQIVKAMEPEERIKLIEMLWEVAYADGVLDPDEDALIRRVAGLVYVSDQERAAYARRRVRERLGLS